MPPEKHAAEAETQTDVHQPEESGNRAWAGRDQEVQTTGLLEGDVSTLEGTSVPAAVETSDKEIQTDVQDIASSVPADTAPAAPELPLQQERASNPAERTALQASDAGPTEPMEEEAKVTEILVKIAQSRTILITTGLCTSAIPYNPALRIKETALAAPRRPKDNAAEKHKEGEV